MLIVLLHSSNASELCDDDYDELLNVNNLSTNENEADTGSSVSRPQLLKSIKCSLLETGCGVITAFARPQRDFCCCCSCC